MTGGNDKAPLQQELNQKPVEVVIGLGANLGDPKAMLEAVLEELKNIPQTELVRASPFYRTAPVESSGPDYVNAVAVCSTRLAPEAFLDALQRLENIHGRVRPVGVVNAPRTLDLDVLLWGEAVIQTPRLTVPHRRMHLRAFVLRPLLDVLPACVIPGLGRADAWLAKITDQRIDPL